MVKKGLDFYIGQLYKNYPQLTSLNNQLNLAFQLLIETISSGKKIITCGNGGSAADAEHIVGELMKVFLLRRPLSDSQAEGLRIMFGKEGQHMADHLQQAVPALSLVSGVSFSTAFANDVAPELVFAQQIWGLGLAGDLLWGISTSGNSANVNYAFRAAKAKGLKTLGLTGCDGGTMSSLCDVEIRMPSYETPRIQELHLPVYHMLCMALEEELYG